MANHAPGKGRPKPPAAKRPGLPAFSEPEMRRWPHPVDSGTISSRQQTDTLLCYIHCALSYQNQLLAEIKALLEPLAADAPRLPEEK